MEARIRRNRAAPGMNHHNDPQASTSSSSTTTTSTTWPCANCHCQVEGDQHRCSNCHGIQVKVIIEDSSSRLLHHPKNNPSTARHNLNSGGPPTDACYLERLATSPAALLTPTTLATVRWVGEIEEEERSVGPRTPTPPTTVPVERVEEKVDDDYKYEYNDNNDDDEYDEEDDDDNEDEATLEASPGQSFDVVYLDDVDFLRPSNPVAAILASVPSPVPAALKLDWSSEPYNGVGDILIHHKSGSDLGIESKRRATASFAAASIDGLAAAASSTEATTTGTGTGGTAWWPPPKKQQRVL